jgi:amino-acid N-acetyltransferase
VSVEIRHPTVAHAEGIFQLINRLAAKGQMLPRSKYQIVTSLMNFLVALDGGEVVGCGAFIPLWTDLGEIRSTAVDEARQGQGIGRLLVQGLIEDGRRLAIPEIFVLTYQVGFWAKLGFVVTDKDRFPRKVWRECLECPKLEMCDETAMHLML